MEDSGELRALLPGELESIIISATPSDVKKLGSAIWIEWHQRLQKLQQQAVLEASCCDEEITKNAIISNGKIPLLIHEAICISIWRQKILPKILQMNKSLDSTFLLYAVLYHESVAAGLLELICFDEEACQSISELLVDLIDYCIEMITGVVGLINSGFLKTKPNKLSNDTTEELEKQQKDLQFDIGLRCITIVSCLTNALDKIHVSASARMYETHDVPLLMTELLQIEPWQRQDHKGNIQIFTDGQWKTMYEEDLEKMSRYETLTWLAVWRLMLNPELTNYYEVNNFRKTQICKLLYRITDVRMDQIPVLMDLKRSLGQLSVADIAIAPKGNKRPVLLEVLPQIKISILKKLRKKEHDIAKTQFEEYFNPNKDDMIELAKKLSTSYTSEVLEQIDGGGAKCATCGNSAVKKCSRCKSEWYCGRECQVKRWSQHKNFCDTFVSITK